MIVKHGRSSATTPFDMSDIERSSDGVLRYQHLPQSLVHLLRDAVRRSPDRECIVVVGGERATYRQVWDRAVRVAGGLAEAGIRPGDRVAINLGNGIEWCLAFWGTVLAGGVAVPVNTRFSAHEVDYVVDDSGATYVIADPSNLPDGEPTVHEDAQRSSLAAIFYTSGTTGFPKGAMTTHENFLANCENCRRIMLLDRGTHWRNLVSVPLFHVTGCNGQLVLTTGLNGTTIILPTFAVQTFLRAIVDERVDIVASVPAVFWLAMNQANFDQLDVSSVRRVTYGGAPAAPELIRRLRTGFPNARLGNGFGLTETSSVSTFLPDELAELRPETVGFAVPCVELDLVDVDGESGVGELAIRGQNVVAGYWNKPEQTAETFVDGWLHTGDLARIDEQGLVQIVDRMKDMVNRGGENVYCVEVENVLAEHPSVYESAVVGVADEMMGEKVGAIVVLRDDAVADPVALRSFLRQRIADYKVPQYFAFRSELLPRNAGGKVLKPALRAETTWSEQLRD